MPCGYLFIVFYLLLICAMPVGIRFFIFFFALLICSSSPVTLVYMPLLQAISPSFLSHVGRPILFFRRLGL